MPGGEGRGFQKRKAVALHDSSRPVSFSSSSLRVSGANLCLTFKPQPKLRETFSDSPSTLHSSSQVPICISAPPFTPPVLH